jgi:hypothetical protein
VNPSVRSRSGYLKVAEFAKIAAGEGYDYLWVDTCCIDKNSSHELSEAINSMYRYYQNAEVCYVYLEDLRWTTSRKEISHNLPRCRWFTRAWTLQELLAPKNIVIYDRNFKARNMMESDILSAMDARTKIPVEVLRKETDIKSINVATKMTWAAGREAAHEEDIAYSLLGIFDVNMSLLYGEGTTKAFIRLQREIIATCTADESIFAWHSDSAAVFGLLAESPSQFRSCLGTRRSDTSKISHSPWTYWNAGLKVSLNMRQHKTGGKAKYDVYLDLVHEETGKCPSFVLVSLGGAWVRQGALQWQPSPFSDFNVSQTEVFVCQQRQSVPRTNMGSLEFEFRPSPDFSDYFLADSCTLTYPEQPMPDAMSEHKRPHKAAERAAQLTLREAEAPNIEYKVKVWVLWDDAALSWKCGISIDDGDSTIPYFTLITKNGMLEAIYYGEGYGDNGYKMIASVPEELPWDHEGPVIVGLHVELLSDWVIV